MKIKILYALTIIALLINIGCGSLPAEYKYLENRTVFKISDNKEAIVLNGIINSSALKEFKKLEKQYPTIKILEIVNCEGSINDNVNLKLAAYIYKQKFNIHLLDNGLIASGGTDLFLAGAKRTKGVATKIGVHSWGGQDDNGKTVTASDFPVGHKHHLPYIAYYVTVGFTQQDAEAFYYFTINAASFDDVHWMTDKEVEEYKILKQ